MFRSILLPVLALARTLDFLYQQGPRLGSAVSCKKDGETLCAPEIDLLNLASHYAGLDEQNQPPDHSVTLHE